MKAVRAAAASLALLATAIAAPAFAWPVHHHGSGVRLGLYLGPGWYGPWYYPQPAYPVYPSTVIVQESAPVYIQRAPDGMEGQPPSAPAPMASSPAPGVWYFCAKPEGYYPYVKQCPGGWRQVPAQPSPQP
ncbi:hypothetical protein [Noviherbaspirillum galbum]|uniref:Lipoprotein n=1 Tax=Noviherbaspirillum galbum TaxID=2709383 RepID=A0A6B3SQX4_9BURK|nr:hypothetical protein [Noviherbaspirillum galbum]NEX63041.1 hypothetical protein [Noviherbaspirillum galbum]